MSEKDPEKLPWKDLNIEVVIESTGFFTKRESAGIYIYSGAKMVVVSNYLLVSTDLIQSPFASIVDLNMTRVVGGDLVKIMAWYDNEWSFTNQMIRQINEA